MEQKTIICPLCEGIMQEKEIVKKFVYKDEEFLIKKFPVLECDECSESFINEKKMRPVEIQVKAEQKKIDELLAAPLIRQIRRNLGKTQKELSVLLGGGEKGFARYEKGAVAQSKPMDNLLRLISWFPGLLTYFEHPESEEHLEKHVFGWSSSSPRSPYILCLSKQDTIFETHYKSCILFDYHKLEQPSNFQRKLENEENELSVQF